MFSSPSEEVKLEIFFHPSAFEIVKPVTSLVENIDDEHSQFGFVAAGGRWLEVSWYVTEGLWTFFSSPLLCTPTSRYPTDVKRGIFDSLFFHWWYLSVTGATSYQKQGSRSFVQLRLTLKNPLSGDTSTEVMEVGIEQFYNLLKTVEQVNVALNV